VCLWFRGAALECSRFGGAVWRRFRGRGECRLFAGVLEGWWGAQFQAALGVGPTDELARRLVADAKRVGPGVRAALKALVGAGRSATGFHRRRVAYGGPVSVVWGDRDALVLLAHAQAILKALPQARLHVWLGMGHHPQRERPHELAKLVEASARDAAADGRAGESRHAGSACVVETGQHPQRVAAARLDQCPRASGNVGGEEHPRRPLREDRTISIGASGIREASLVHDPLRLPDQLLAQRGVGNAP
jgi:hypothetical protein